VGSNQVRPSTPMFQQKKEDALSAARFRRASLRPARDAPTSGIGGTVRQSRLFHVQSRRLVKPGWSRRHAWSTLRLASPGLFL